MEKVDMKYLDQVIRAADQDDDGTVTFGEFVAMMTTSEEFDEE